MGRVRRWLLSHVCAALPAGADRIGAERRALAGAVAATVDRLFARRALKHSIAAKVVLLWMRSLVVPPESRPQIARFRTSYGSDPPWFLTIGPGHGCNLACSGCYAASTPEGSKLEWPQLTRIIEEAKALWGIRLVVFSGGEPLLYRSQEKDLLDIVEQHPDLLFLMFSNGTLVDAKTAARLARLGNLTPAFSVEGLRASTDGCRGAGVFDRVLAAMDLMGRAGVPFGVSVSVTATNCEEVLSDEFLDLFFTRIGAFYAFFFQYLPIGRGTDLSLMPTPQQRMDFRRRTWEMIEQRGLFLIDFWNHGPLAEGCISAGRAGGYLYIDWNGKVMPCVFAPYAGADIHRIYAEGGSLNDAWNIPFFRAIRAWQVEHGYGSGTPQKEHNWLSPCPFRDHYGQFRTWIEQYRPQPEDESARRALLDNGYFNFMEHYGDRFRELSSKEWEERYLPAKE